MYSVFFFKKRKNDNYHFMPIQVLAQLDNVVFGIHFKSLLLTVLT